MKVSCLQDRLAKGLSIVGRAVATRSVLPVLSNILIATDESRIKLSATNLEIGINCWIGGRVDEEGGTTVPARLLSEFVGSLPKEAKIDMDLDVRTQTLNLKCAQHNARMKGIDASEFPPIPSGDGTQHIPLEANALRRMIDQVIFAAAADESRPILTGILARFQEDKLTLAAADGFRLSLRELSLGQPVPAPVSVIIPNRALGELSRIVGSVETDDRCMVNAIVTPQQNQILFQIRDADSDVDIVSQLIEGNFPDYRAIIPSSHTTTTTIDTAGFLQAVRVAYLFAREAANIVRLTITPGSDLGPGNMRIAAASAEHGDDVSDLAVQVDGEAVDIAFNAKYLIDVLSVVDEPEIVLETSSPARPGVIRPRGNDSFLCVIMPMHIAR